MTSKYNCTHTFLLTLFFLVICRFLPLLFSTLPLTKLQLQLHNSPFQLQIPVYNCRNCDHLHVKICPGCSQSKTRSWFPDLSRHLGQSDVSNSVDDRNDVWFQLQTRNSLSRRQSRCL